MFKGRSVIEIMVLWFSFIVGFILLATGGTISIVKLLHPETNMDRATDTLFTAITIVLGALLGMLTVRGAATTDMRQRPGEDHSADLRQGVNEEEAIDITDRTE